MMNNALSLNLVENEDKKQIPMLFPGDAWLGFVSMVPVPSGTSCMDLDIHSCL